MLANRPASLYDPDPTHRANFAMGKTLFWYIFRDLLWVFLLTSVALAGIMSFGGLLRPLTKFGLDLAQIGQVLGYSMPAMTNYSWPIAAVFATSFVYGRLSADNELTACRAAGISYFMLMMPALLLGLLVATLSLASLWYVVPESFLRAERVFYGNIARLVSSQVERTQRVVFRTGDTELVIFAQRATVVEEGRGPGSSQKVRLDDVAVVRYEHEGKRQTPVDLFVARNAMAVIDLPRDENGEVMLSAQLEDGAKVPIVDPNVGGQVVQASIAVGELGRYPIASEMRESMRYLTIDRLREVRERPELSRRVSRYLMDLVRSDQQRTFLQSLHSRLTGDERTASIIGSDQTVRIVAGTRPPVIVGDKRLRIESGDAQNPGVRVRIEGREGTIDALARSVVIEPVASQRDERLFVTIDLYDATLLVDGSPTSRQSFQHRFEVPMPPEVARLKGKRVNDYLNADWVDEPARARLRALVTDLTNSIEAERHSRFGFAVSCVTLVIVGACIGLVSRSGNFVGAFAVSSIPAVVAIVLIVSGKHVAENVPSRIPADFSNPLDFGLTLLWSGNVIVALVGLVLYLRLSRT